MYHFFSLFLATPERVVIDDEVEVLNVPGTEGYLEVLSHHAPLITALKPGKIAITHKGRQRSVWATSGGFLEVSHNQATLLVDTIENATEIDVRRAKEALERAQKRLANPSDEMDKSRAERACARAKNRLNVAGVS